MAHAAARRGGAAGDEADDRLAAAALRFVGEELRGVLLGAAADLADHDDRLGLVVGEEHLEHVDELGALDRVAADADRGRLAEALVGGLEHRLVGQRARAADDADAALLEDVGRHDPDLALVRASARPGNWARSAATSSRDSARLTLTMSSTGMPSVMVTISGTSASIASRIESAANGGGT